MPGTGNYFVTTFDNMLNPFTNFKEWFDRDEKNGYRTLELWSSFCRTSPYLLEEDNEYIIEQGTQRFLELNPFGMHYKVYEDEADKLIPLMYNTYKSLQKDKDSAKQDELSDKAEN